MVLLESKYLFIGSRFCDSVLMKIDYSLLCVDANGKEVDHQLLDQSSGTNNTLKNSKLADGKSIVEDYSDEVSFFIDSQNIPIAYVSVLFTK